MEQEKKLRAIKELIQSAQNAIINARKIINELTWDSKWDDIDMDTNGLTSYSSWDTKIIEGVFTGESMLWSDGNIYPIPQNYASKSHLIQGSKLKATIDRNGKILYKIIEEMEYESHVGVLTKNQEKYQVITDTKSYHILLAAITFHKCEIWDTVSIRIPKWKDATYAAIEAKIPKLDIS